MDLKHIIPLVTLCFFVQGCKEKQSEEVVSTYNTLIVEKQSCTLQSEYTAKIEGQQVVEIRPQVSGLITKILINEGQKVRRGQTLFVIDQVPYQAALSEASANVKNAEAKLATARLDLEHAKRLREKDIVQDYNVITANNTVLSAEAALALAQAQEVNARNNLSYTEVKSPVDGVAGMINYRVGALVSSSISTPLVTVSDDSNVYAYFSITESQVIDLVEQYGSLDNAIAQMPDVTLRMSNGKEYSHMGRISAVSGIVSSTTGSVTLRADFTNPDHLLRGGGSGTVVLPTAMSDCIIIPSGATYELQDRVFVYKVIGGKAVSSPVTLFRLNNGTEYVVQEGLEVGDVIIAEGAGLVREGAIVTPADNQKSE